MKKEHEQGAVQGAPQQATKPAETPYTNTEAAPGIRIPCSRVTARSTTTARARQPKTRWPTCRRAVIGLQHRFDPQTKFAFELESEHAVTSARTPERSRSNRHSSNTDSLRVSRFAADCF